MNDVIIDLGQVYHNVTLQIYSLTGQIISQNYFESANRVNCELVGIEGLYFLEIFTKEGKKATLKVLKK
ncbi:MAG: hypothetical protein DRI70_08485 [Bacteroidetes bacterium]|nr:MAG: hypothetical protein DRI70_08485 [Bacteroidota bacterium]